MNKHIVGLIAIAAQCCLGEVSLTAAAAAGRGAAVCEVSTAGLSIDVNDHGTITGVMIGSNRLERTVLGQTMLEGCVESGVAGCCG